MKLPHPIPYQGSKRNLAAQILAFFPQGIDTLIEPFSYDGRTGQKVHGRPLPRDLRLCHIELAAGRSSQETLLGRAEITYESLYLSPALTERLELPRSYPEPQAQQPALLEAAK